MKSDLLALATILLWGSLAALTVSLSHLPPLLLTGLGLLMGSLISLPLSRFRISAWRVPLSTLAIGVYGLFGYHLLLFIALQNAPAAPANLVNYLWPVFIVLLTPLLLRGQNLRPLHLLAVLLGFSGAGIAIFSGSELTPELAFAGSAGWGYLSAFGAAIVWSTYSVLTKRVAAFDTAAIGLFALVAGVLALTAHFLLEPQVAISASDWLLLALLGMGPLGGAFYLWDAAIKRGDTRRIGVLAFLTPLISTAMLLISQGQPLSLGIVLATALIIAAAVAGHLAGRSERSQASQRVS